MAKTIANQSRCILLVEDDPHDAELAGVAFFEQGLDHELITVGDGEQALDFLQRRGAFAARPQLNPALVVLDLKLPKMSGHDVLKRLKHDSALQVIPAVVFSSSSEERDIVASYDLGANAYVVKPLVFDDFVETVRRMAQYWASFNQPPPGSVACDPRYPTR
ncbi:MAG TPA: response regulator [Phycisphaerae bacterium]